MKTNDQWIEALCIAVRDANLAGTVYSQRTARTMLVLPILQEIQQEAQLVPGAWYCPKCSFEQFRRVLHARSGTIGADSVVADTACPNDGELMLQQTWQYRLESVSKAFETQLVRIAVLEAAIEKVKPDESCMVCDAAELNVDEFPCIVCQERARIYAHLKPLIANQSSR